MKKITDELIDSMHKNMWDEMTVEYGSIYKIPRERTALAGEIIRGMYVLQLWQREGQTKSAMSFLSSYSVMTDVAEELVRDLFGDKAVEKEKANKPEKRKNKWGAFMEWAKSKDGKEFTTEQLVKQSGFSYQTTLNFVNETPEFIKVKRGLYRISIAKRPD